MFITCLFVMNRIDYQKFRVIAGVLSFVLLSSYVTESCHASMDSSRIFGSQDAIPRGLNSVEEVTNRIGETCSKDDIAVYQGPTAPLPNGIPTYTVQILNVCVTGCTIANIHVSCGWFSSARMINPKVFRRVCYDDCLVNNGDALGPGESLSFQYANSFSYPLTVSSVSCY